MYMTQATANDSYKNANYFGPLVLAASTTGINALPGKERSNQLVSIFPNPAVNRMKIERKNDSSEPLLVEIHSITGALVKSVNFTGSNEVIEIGDLQGGVYVLKISSDKHFQSERIIKR
jgi:hypothetical protein